MKNILKIAVVGMVLATSACTQTTGYKQMGGTILGGAGGAVAGAQFGKGKGNLAMVALGTLLGAYVGNEIGASLDRADQMALQQAQGRALNAPMGQTIQWDGRQYGSQSGAYGSFTPTRDGRDTATGQYCREYQSTIYVGGQQQQAYGVACRQMDGSWKVQQ